MVNHVMNAFLIQNLTFWWQVYVYIFQAVHKLSEGSITVKDLCEKCIKRLEKTRQLNAFITETFESSRNVAVEIDRKRQKQKSNFTLTSICNHTQWRCVLTLENLSRIVRFLIMIILLLRSLLIRLVVFWLSYAKVSNKDTNMLEIAL